MSQSEVENLARELMTAYESGEMVPVPPSERPGFNLDTAYAVEAALKQFRQAHGHRAIGRKVGYANKAMWRVLKLETLVWAHMYDDTVHYVDQKSDQKIEQTSEQTSERNLNHNPGYPRSATLTVAHPRSLKIEPEIIFGLKQPLISEGLDAAAALATVDWLAIGFEIIDCPFPAWKFQPSDFVASFGLHAALVVGERVQVRPENIPALVDELLRFKVRISKNGEFVEEGFGRNSLKSPALCLAELGAGIGRRFPNEPLREEEIISSGTLTAGHAAERNDSWTVEVEGLSLLSSLPPLTMRLT